jgi:hypothetical protein
MVLVNEEKMMVNVHVKVLVNDSNHQYTENLNTKADGRRVVRLYIIGFIFFSYLLEKISNTF